MTGFRQDGYPLIVTAGVVYKDDAVLIARRTAGALEGLWEFPGGKLERGESPEECLTRELREELGLNVEIEDIFRVVYHVYAHGPVLLLAYRCRPLDTKSGNAREPPASTKGVLRKPHGQGQPVHDPVPGVARTSQAENPPSRWVRISDLPLYSFTPADKPIVEKLLRSGRL